MSTIYTNIRHNVYSWYSGLYNFALELTHLQHRNDVLDSERETLGVWHGCAKGFCEI